MAGTIQGNTIYYSNGLGGIINCTLPQLSQFQPSPQAEVNQIPVSIYSIQQFAPYTMNNGYYYNLQPQFQQGQCMQPVSNTSAYKMDDSKNKAENFNDWTDEVGMNPGQAAYQFQIKSDDSKKKKDYMKDLENISDEYIKMYDTDNDGKISFDEFWEKELANAEEKYDEFDKDEKKVLNKKLKTIYNHLNVTNAGASKNALTKAEVMNMFLTMDTTNSAKKADGSISKDEYMAASQFLADESKDSESNGNWYTKVLKQNYKKHFHEKY